MQRYFKGVAGLHSGNYIYFPKSKGLSDENITAPTTSDYKHNPQLSYFGTKIRVEFNESCSQQDKFTYYHGKVINIYIIYEINKNFNISSYPTLKIVYLVQLAWLKMLTFIGVNILDMVLDSIDMDFISTLDGR